jgi:ribosome-associated protein
VTPEAGLRVNGTFAIPEGELRESASRSRGPGGQHVNKASTRVTLRWNVRESRALAEAQRALLVERLGARITRAGAIVVHADRFRSRERNRALARERLAELVRDGLSRRRPRLPTRPGRAARERALAAKRRRGEAKRARRAPAGDDA